MDLKEFIYKNVIIPFVIDLNTSGIIVNRVTNKLGINLKPLRFIYCFRCHFNNLYLTTYKYLGEKETYSLFYKIGKESVLLAAKVAGIRPPNKNNSRLFLKLMLLSTHTTGIEFENIIFFEYLTKTVVVQGKNKVWNNEIKNGFFPGMLSAYCGIIFNQNVEAEYIKHNPDDKIIKASLSIPPKHKVDMNILFNYYSDYHKLNFPDRTNNVHNYRSFSHLVKFKKIKMNKEQIFHLKNQPLFPFPIINDIIVYNFKKSKHLDILKKGLVNSAESLAPKILESQTHHQQLEEIKTILCAFGWGFPYHEFTKKGVIMTFVHPPYSKFGFEFYAYEFNGYLNYIFKKNFKVKKIETRLNPVIIKIFYEH